MGREPRPEGPHLHDYRLRLGDREWSVLHTDAVLSWADESRFLSEGKDRLPYGVVLWPAAIALAHEVAARVDEMRGARVFFFNATATTEIYTLSLHDALPI